VRRIALLAALMLAGCGHQAKHAAAPTPEPTPAFRRAPEPTTPHGRYLTARVMKSTWLRAKPNGRALHRLDKRTEFGSRMVLGVVAVRGDWLKVTTARLPNHRRAWIPRSRVKLRGTDLDITVDRSEHRAMLRRDGRVVLRWPVAVGRPGNETPLGRFAVTDLLRLTDPTSPYGCCAVALSGHQTKLVPGWIGGDRLAIHATPQPETIGKAVSLGCMRSPTRVMRRLIRTVPLGAPVFVRA
jgi:lipoprotein-anchoring transpeptidase ErfK/SrfK